MAEELPEKLELLVQRAPGVVQRVVHEISWVQGMHRLLVDGVTGSWTHTKAIAAVADYRAVTNHFAPTLPRVFIACDVTTMISVGAPDGRFE